MDWTEWARAVAALGVTLALLGGAAYAARRLGMTQGRTPGQKRRIELVESLMLDPRRRLVLVAVDGRDHLILLSPFGDRPIHGPAAAPAPTPTPEEPTP